MAKHTPGPWNVCSGGRSWNGTGECRGYTVAAGAVGPILSDRDDLSRSDANLIAAAPDLLAAAEAAEHVLTCTLATVDADGGNPRWDRAQPLLDQLRTAIARAKGGGK